MSSNVDEDMPQRTLIGVLLKMPCPAFVELAGYCGADLVVLDTEHGVRDDLELEHHIRAADSAGIDVLVRVPSNDSAYIQAALDAGAKGVIVPHIESVDDARRAVRSAHYPPYGDRGLALTTRAGKQATTTLEEHLQVSRDGVWVIGQIEDMSGVDASGAIAEVERLDVVWIGTNDLAMSLRGKVDDVDAALDAAVATVCESLRVSNTRLMVLAADAVQAERWIGRGASIVLVTAHDLFGKALRAYLGDVSRLATPTGSA